MLERLDLFLLAFRTTVQSTPDMYCVLQALKKLAIRRQYHNQLKFNVTETVNRICKCLPICE